MKKLRGETYSIKNELKSKYQAKWDGVAWSVLEAVYDEAQAFVDDHQPLFKRCRSCGTTEGMYTTLCGNICDDCV